jgi:hypothetical protein
MAENYGKTSAANPYPIHTVNYSQWRKGWFQAKREKLRTSNRL